MHLWIIIVDLGLAVASFLCGGAVACFGWTTSISVAADDRNPGRTKSYLRMWILVIALALFGSGLYDLKQLAEQRFVPLLFGLTQALFLGLFAALALWILRGAGRYRRVEALVEHGQTEEAIELIEGWIRSARKPSAYLHHMLGMIHVNTGHPEAAVAELRQAVEISGELPGYLSSLAIAVDSLGQTDEALRLLEQAEQADPAGRAVYLHNRCCFLARAGRIEEARKLLPQVEKNHERITARFSPLQKRKIAETLSEMQQLCDRPAIDSVPSD